MLILTLDLPQAEALTKILSREKRRTAHLPNTDPQRKAVLKLIRALDVEYHEAGGFDGSISA
jgi:hypothetical protein